MQFVHPISKRPLIQNEAGDYQDSQSGSTTFQNYTGSCDFVINRNDNEERLYYDKAYEEAAARVKTSPCSAQSIESAWQQESALSALFAAVMPLQGRTVLLLGNGDSLKELEFLRFGAGIVFTDLSMSAVRYAKEAFACSELAADMPDRIQFHAVDAMHLPFGQDSFDVIYGCKFVHHIRDLDSFFGEVFRCLKPGGRCIFFDDAKSPLWHGMKSSVLKPLQMLSHRITGISPEDLEATRKGGFTRVELSALMERHGFDRMIFKRRAFLEYLTKRGADKLFGRTFRMLVPLARWIDHSALGERFMARHGIRLIWGFEKTWNEP